MQIYIPGFRNLQQQYGKLPVSPFEALGEAAMLPSFVMRRYTTFLRADLQHPHCPSRRPESRRRIQSQTWFHELLQLSALSDDDIATVAVVMI